MNYVAIIVGTLLIMLLGFIWFHPKVLGTSWMKGAGLTEDDIKDFNPMVMVGALLASAVIAYATSK